MRNNYSTPKPLRSVLRAVSDGLRQSSSLPHESNLSWLRRLRFDLNDNREPSEPERLTGDRAGIEPA